VSTIPDAEHVLATIEAGAAGYVTKDNDLPALVSANRGRLRSGGCADG
jgi:two-component system nitrate/nitrite response regulator NarL